MADKTTDVLDAPAKSAHGLDILVVEDYPDSAQSLEILLRILGHKVEIAKDGPTALQKAQSKAPDVVLLDIGLPGMNGWEVAKKLQEQIKDKKLFFIAITAHGQEEDHRRSIEAGLDIHLVKPANPQQLADILRRFQRVVQ
jgi:CheY-like chemotaxis protein